MKIIIERSHLLKSLAHVQSVVEKRGTIAILSNIKLEAKGAEVAFTATDMDIAIVEKSPANVLSAGEITIPAQTFYDIVRKIPEGAQIELETSDDGSKATIRSGQSRFSLACLPVDDFPVMAEGEFSHSFTLKSAECLALISKPSFAVSTEENRYYLNGIFLHVAGEGDGKVLRAVATDGHRLAQIEVAIPAGADGMPSVIVPRKAIYELRKLLEAGEGDVEVSLCENKIRFIYGSAVLVSKLIDGEYPDYSRVIPLINDKLLEVDCKKFAQSVDRVSVISSEKTRGIKLQVESGKLTFSAGSGDQAASEEIEVAYSSAPIETGFNSRYLLEMMTQMEGEIAQFLFSDGTMPALVRDTADVSALYVIMPMRV
jgi:DNA polymerase-3 subunit beta